VKKSAPPAMTVEIKPIEPTEKANAPTNVNSVVPCASYVVSATIGQYTLPFLVDTGADVSAVRLDVVNKIGLRYFTSEPSFKSASGHVLDSVGETCIKFTLGKLKFCHEFAVVRLENTGWFAILGTDFLIPHAADVMLAQRKLMFPLGAVPMVQRSSLDSVNYNPHALDGTFTQILHRHPSIFEVSNSGTAKKDVTRAGRHDCASRSTGDNTIVAHAQLVRTGSQRCETFSTNVIPTSALPHTTVGVSFTESKLTLEPLKKQCETTGLKPMSTGLPNRTQRVQPSRSTGAEVPPTPPPFPRNLRCNDENSPLLKSILGKMALLNSARHGGCAIKAQQTGLKQLAQISLVSDQCPGFPDTSSGVIFEDVTEQTAPISAPQNLGPEVTPPEVAEAGNAQTEPPENVVKLDRPLKLSANSETLFFLHAKWAKNSTLALTMQSDDASDIGILPCVVKSTKHGEVPVLFYNNTGKNVTLPAGEINFISAEKCTVQSEWLKREEEPSLYNYCQGCHTHERKVRVPKSANRCEACDSSSAKVSKEPIFWPEKPEQAITDEEFLALFDLGEDFYNCHAELKTLLLEFKDIFVWGETNLGRTHLAECDIDTGDSEPVAMPLHRIPLEHRKTVIEAIQTMLKMGIIRRSSSPWSSSLLIVPKRDPAGRIKSWRPCADYRALNIRTKKKRYPFRSVQDIFDTIGKVGPISTVDFACGYWQIPMTKRASERAAFTTFNGHWEPLTMSFGLANAPAVFCELVDKVFEGLIGNGVHAFVDDIFCTGGTVRESLDTLKKVFVRVRSSGLRLQPKKCCFMRKSVEFLGHILDSSGLRPNPDRVKAIKDRPKPSTLKGLRSFLGSINFYRRFFQGYAKIAAPLTDLTKGGGKSSSKLEWNAEADAAYERIVEMLTTAPCLRYPEDGLKYHLTTDASSVALGGVLEIEDKDGVRHPVGYFSQRLHGAQKKYSSTQAEMLSVCQNVQFFRTYLLGRSFVLHTDNLALLWLLRQNEPKPMLARWILLLSEYDFEVYHIKGSLNQMADMLSRPDGNDDVEPSITMKALINLIAAESRDTCAARVKEQQLQDEHLLHIREVLLTGSFHNMYEYFLDDREIIYMQSENGPLMCIPASMREDVLHNLHRTITGGHVGAQKLIAALKERYFWPGLSKDAKAFVAKCMKCIKRKGTPDTGPGQQIGRTPLRFMEMIMVDVVGPLSVCPVTGARFLLTIIEASTRFPECVPLPDVRATTVAKALVEHFICRYGMPEKILSDWGSNFRSRTFAAMLKLLKIKQIHCSPFSPQNNMVEPMHKTLADYISIYISEQGTKLPWTAAVPYALLSLRSHMHTSTRAAPSMLMYGRKITLPGDLDIAPLFEPRELPKEGEEFLEELKEQLATVRGEAAKNDLISRENTLAHAKQPKRHEVPIEVGDRVLIKEMSHRDKFDFRLKGPFTVTSKYGVTYHLENLNAGRGQPRHFTFHRRLMRNVEMVLVNQLLTSGNRQPARPLTSIAECEKQNPQETVVGSAALEMPQEAAEVQVYQAPENATSSLAAENAPAATTARRGRGRPRGSSSRRVDSPANRPNAWTGRYELRKQAGTPGEPGFRG